MSDHALPHGGNVETMAAAWGCQPRDILDLSTGLHPDGAPAWLAAWLSDHAHLAAIYPQGDGEPARSALAAAFSVDRQQLLITAGAQAAIEAVFPAFGWRTLAIRTPCYSEPLRCARRSGCQITPYDSGKPPAADVLWVTSPNNPCGTIDEPWQTGGTEVWDESYAPFSQRRARGVVANTIRIGSLTKIFCIPGLRLGYVIACQSQIEQLRCWLPPWPTSTLALHLLPHLLPEADARDQAVVTARLRLSSLLQRHGWSVRPSQAAFLLAKPASAPPDVARHRILLRTFPEWPQLEGWVRFGLPASEADWQRLDAALSSKVGA